MIIVVMVAGWIFYGRPDAPSGVSTNAPVQAPAEEPGEAAGEANHEAADESPYLLDHLPFKEEEVLAITAGGNGIHADVPAERRFVLLQSLRYTDMKSALAAPVPAASRKPIVLQFKLADTHYELTYDLTDNAFEYQGQYYYADDQVLLLIQGLFREREELASLDALLEQARVEQEQAGTVDPDPLDAEAARVDGLDFDGWEQRLAKAQPEEIVWAKPFYDDGTGQVKQARLFKDGVLAVNRMIVFTRPEHQSADGVKTGIGTEDVIAKLGPQALKLVSRWSYKVGDYFRFHVYYADGKVKYLALSQPL
ncbi:hypothetical protein MJ257_15840 [Paenibacillus timonensis]|uniref:DUF4309 domain-containing protein n=1 Tax=Paenibacillus timonensis TaxID=225915 RepID=A0ABW3SE32_9BACL|nr:hypothetical protein [Paenibacillus timonensis]MCH1641582.1 hypothetical protein [Paenibacillus timonensis]